MKLVIEGNSAKLASPIPARIVQCASQMEGRKYWLQSGGFSFEPTHHNLDLFRSVFPDAEIEDQRETFAMHALATGLGQAGQKDPSLGGPTSEITYQSLTQPYGKFQDEATAHSLQHPFAAIFMEQGTGKSKVAIDVAGTRWCNWQITGMIVIAFNGVHIQWIEEAVPQHLGAMVPRRTWAYRPGKKLPDWMKQRDKLAILTINFESVPTKAGAALIRDFINAHAGRVMSVVDESQRIKNAEAKSSMEIVDLGRYCLFRMILTGTPIAKELTDEWAQFKYLDDSILGHKYKVTFRSQFCVTRKVPHGEIVVGHKNVELFYSKVAPYCFRVTKADVLDLPPKVYDNFTFELHPTQRRLYDDMKRTFIAQLDSGEVSTVRNAAVLVMRLQQITCGYLALDKDDPDEATRFEILPNPRLDALKQVLRSRLGKAVIWCRFTRDIENVMETYGSEAVSYYGDTGSVERIEAKRSFIDPNTAITKFVSNPAAGGTGVDGLQKVARTAIYYSNSFNSIHRWQSEDRTHRIGMGGTCTYIDLIARNTVDRAILANLRNKKALSDLVLDDIRKMLIEDEE